MVTKLLAIKLNKVDSTNWADLRSWCLELMYLTISLGELSDIKWFTIPVNIRIVKYFRVTVGCFLAGLTICLLCPAIAANTGIKFELMQRYGFIQTKSDNLLF